MHTPITETATQFPYILEQPTMRLKLPVGTYVFDLTAVDTADVPSLPAKLIVKVEPDPGSAPATRDFAPTRLPIGGTANPFVIKGAHLVPAHVIAVQFIFTDDTPDPLIRTTIKPGSAAGTLLLSVEVDRNAKEGNRCIQVTMQDKSTWTARSTFNLEALNPKP